MVNRWLKFNQSILPPASCLLCETPTSGQALCTGCLQDLPWNLHACERCAIPLPEELLICGECRPRPPPQQYAIAPLRYVFPVDSLIGGLKYSRQLAHSPLLGQLLLDAVMATERPLPQLILPVPLHPLRLAERGYNQALEIARPLAKTLGLPLETQLVTRVRHTRSQRTLDARARLHNLDGVFGVNTTRLATLGHPTHIALVDDVLTTGATVGTLASLLQRHGVTDIDVWCVARTP